jgi:hypothetical protein
MLEGSGSGSIPLTTGSRSGRPKNMWIRWIRIRIRGSGSGTMTKSSKIFRKLKKASNLYARQASPEPVDKDPLFVVCHRGFESSPTPKSWTCWEGKKSKNQKCLSKKNVLQKSSLVGQYCASIYERIRHVAKKWSNKQPLLPQKSPKIVLEPYSLWRILQFFTTVLLPGSLQSGLHPDRSCAAYGSEKKV